jgi:isopentenyl-diphosphate delta-isomerase
MTRREAAKAIRLGADMVGQGAGVLTAAMVSTEAVVAHFETVIRQMRTVSSAPARPV